MNQSVQIDIHNTHCETLTREVYECPECKRKAVFEGLPRCSNCGISISWRSYRRSIGIGHYKARVIKGKLGMPTLEVDVIHFKYLNPPKINLGRDITFHFREGKHEVGPFLDEGEANYWLEKLDGILQNIDRDTLARFKDYTIQA